MKFSTCTIAPSGLTIRKYATAFTRAGTLSFVITSCGGMFSVIVRRSTLTIRSTIGIRMKSPGPFGSGRGGRAGRRCPLVLPRHLDRTDREQQQQEDDDREDDQSDVHGSSLDARFDGGERWHGSIIYVTPRELIWYVFHGAKPARSCGSVPVHPHP